MKAQELGLRVVLLRNGVVLSKHGGILHRMLTPFRLGIGGRVGSGTQWLPWIHMDDEIGLIRHAISHQAVSGALNAVAPEPVTNAEFSRALGEVLHRPVAIVAPAFALRLAMGVAGRRGAAGEPAGHAGPDARDRLHCSASRCSAPPDAGPHEDKPSPAPARPART